MKIECIWKMKVKNKLHDTSIHIFYISLKIIIGLCIFWFYISIALHEFKWGVTMSIIPFITYGLFGSFLTGFILQWLIFLNVNPYPLENNNKYKIMNYVPEEWKPEQQFMLDNCDISKLKYPVIVKPVVCSGGSVEVFKVDNQEALVKIIQENKLDVSDFMVQTFLKDYPREVGILYEKYPWSNKGHIFEMVEKTNKEDIRHYNVKDSIDRTSLITEKLNTIIDQISDKIPGLCAARHDIVFKNMEELLNGEFKIVEVNGTMGMQLSNDGQNLDSIMVDFYWLLRRMAIGLYNICTMKGYSPQHLIICMYKSLKSGITCADWENFFSLYS